MVLIWKVRNAHPVNICIFDPTVRMKTYISETMVARANKSGVDMCYYCMQIKLVLEFEHSPFRPHKSIKAKFTA